MNASANWAAPEAGDAAAAAGMLPPEGDVRPRPAAVAALGALVFGIGAVRVVAEVVISGAPAPVERVGLHPGEAELAGAPAVPAPEAPPQPAPWETAGDRVIQPPPDAFDDAASGTAASCPARAAPAPGGGTWAVIVGVNDYPGGGHDLLASVNDAREVDVALGRLGVPAANRLVLLDGQASACGVRAALDWLVAGAAPEATGVFFFAGHARLRGSGRVLVGADGVTISDDELAASLGRLRASRAWIALATCYGAGFTSVLGPGRILTGAAGARDLAYEAVGSERSYMVEYMVHRAIVGGAAPGSVEAAYAYARAALAGAAPGRVPVQIDQAPRELDLRPSTRVPLPARAPLPAPVGPAGSAPVAPRPPVVPTTRPCKPFLGLLCFG